VNLKSIRRKAEKILNLLQESNDLSRDEEIEVSILLTDNEHIAFLNEEYRQSKGATDVLSFPNDASFPTPGHFFLGDLAISLEKAKEQALENGLKRSDEITILLVHSFLHLLGYTHEGEKSGGDNEDGVKMRSKEQEILQKLGFTHGLMGR